MHFLKNEIIILRNVKILKYLKLFKKILDSIKNYSFSDDLHLVTVLLFP